MPPRDPFNPRKIHEGSARRQKAGRGGFPSLPTKSGTRPRVPKSARAAGYWLYQSRTDLGIAVGCAHVPQGAASHQCRCDNEHGARYSPTLNPSSFATSITRIRSILIYSKVCHYDGERVFWASDCFDKCRLMPLGTHQVESTCPCGLSHSTGCGRFLL